MGGAMIVEVAQQIFNGIVIGSVYVLIALGLTVIFGIGPALQIAGRDTTDALKESERDHKGHCQYSDLLYHLYTHQRSECLQHRK